MTTQPQQQPAPQQATPPGWYPDPQAPGTQRYWDGATWTDRTAPLVPAQAAPAQQVVVVQQASDGRGTGRWVSGMTTGGHILHGTLTILTGGLWGIVWFLKWRLGRRRIG